MLRGFNVLFPGVDHGYDLEVEGGIRLQVKSSHLRTTSGLYRNEGVYWFNFRGSRIVTGKNNIRDRSKIRFSQKCQFVVLFGIEQGRFWIVPAELLDEKQLVVVGPDCKYKDLDVDKIKTMYESGRLQREIASEMGVKQVDISQRL
jgi:hypothetical protein